MYTVEEKRIMNLSDIYTIMYSYIVSGLIDSYGVDGESAAREGTRRYGRDRGRTTRQKHLAANAKVNMLHLFSLYFDLPNDPRFRREKQELNPQERVSHTLVCPMADIWKEYVHMKIGRMYCEEFHPACYSEYAYGHTYVNLARTLTQAGDDYCSFNVVLRPADLPKELLPVCFEEYDPDYVKPEFPDIPITAKNGFETISIKLFYHLLSTSVEELGEGASEVIVNALEKFAHEAAKILLKTSEEYGLPVDDELIYENVPITLDFSKKEELWKDYKSYSVQEIWNRGFTVPFMKALKAD